MDLPAIAMRAVIGGALICASLSGAAFAESEADIAGKIQWGLWVDADGCQHWWADGGEEGYMVPRVNPKTGKPVCIAKSTCLVADADALFDTGSATLSPEGRQSLSEFFGQEGGASFAIAGHTDSRGSAASNQELSLQRAAAVGELARSLGAVVERETGFGETQPVASNRTAEGMQRNRRVEVVCYQW